MGMQSGRLDRRITIERFTSAQNGFGERVEAWGPLATVSAEKSYRRAGESVLAGEVAAIRVLRFAIRWSAAVADVNPKDRVDFDGAKFDILEVNEIGRREGIEIFAQARADE